MDFVGALIRMGLLSRIDSLWEEDPATMLRILEVASAHSSTACLFIARTVLKRVMEPPLSDVQLQILRILTLASRSIAFRVQGIDRSEASRLLLSGSVPLLRLLCALLRHGHAYFPLVEIRDILLESLRTGGPVAEILQLVRHYDTIEDAFFELAEYNFS